MSGDDFAALLILLGAFIQQEVRQIEIVRARNPSRSGNSGHLFLFETDAGIDIAVKRCAGNILFVEREALVGVLRQVFGVPHYNVLRRTGIVLRDPSTGRNLQELADWSTAECVLLDFGRTGRRPHLQSGQPGCLEAAQVVDGVRFFTQYGGLVAFNYIVGAQDRHAGNYVLDLDQVELLSVDNEEAPYHSPTPPPPDAWLPNALDHVRMFLPVDAAGSQRCKDAFSRGFRFRWEEMRTRLPLLSGHVGPAFDYIRQRLQSDKVDEVLAKVRV